MPVHEKPSHKYVSSADIRAIFKTQSEPALIQALSALRNQLATNPAEPPLLPNDPRLLLVAQWLHPDPAAHDLFALWQSTNSRQSSLLTPIVGLLSALLNLLSSHYSYHPHAQPLLRALLSQQCSHQLSLYLSAQHPDLILATLKLYNAMSNFAAGKERKSVLNAFPWENKSSYKLLHMRRKSKNENTVDMLHRPDIRTLYISLVLSFLDNSTPSSTRLIFLEQHRDAFTSIFKGLSQDPYSVLRRVLELCWSGFWSDQKLKRTLKLQAFSEATISQLLRIYQRTSAEGPDPESIPADVVHHFLLAICTHPGTGLCFQDRGWYPRETDFDYRGADVNEPVDDDAQRKGSRIYNKILANVLRNLKVNEDPRQQELALKILAACPELVSAYWSSAGLALEPRLSSKWLANIAFFGAVVSLPVPMASFFLPQSGSGSNSLYHPSPPPLSIVLENIIPTAHIKTHLSRGLQSPSPLVQHSCALATAKCLLKFEQVVRAFRQVEAALEEDEEEGLWARRRRELEREVRKRVPEFQVIVGFSQRPSELGPVAGGQDQHKPTEKVPNPTRTALLAESAHRLLWLYHRLLPSVVAEARFDAGKLLQAVEDMLSQSSSASPTGGLDALRQLHIFQLLQESEHFTWSGKSGSKHSNFYILLKAHTITRVPALRTAIVALLRHILAPGILFQHDADEIALWLDSLPLTRRATSAQAPDGAVLTDEGDGVITFLDDCVQRCVKTPYKYFEELQTMYAARRKDMPADSADEGPASSSIGQRPEALPSPLLSTVVEQLGAKLRGKLLSPSDALALFSFARKLLLRIASKSTDLILPKAYAASIASLVNGHDFFPSYTTIRAAIQRDVTLLVSSIEQLQHPLETSFTQPSPAAQDFLARMEKLPESDSEDSKQIAAYDLIDWLRLTRPPLGSSELIRIVQTIERLHKPALRELFQYIDPCQTSLFEGGAIPGPLVGIVPEIGFGTLLMCCTNSNLEGETCRQVLVDSLLARPADAADIRRAIRLVLHRLSSPTLSEATVRAILFLLARIVGKMQSLGRRDTSSMVLFCFDSDVMKALATRPLSGVGREGLSRFLDSCYQVGGEDIAQLFAVSVGRWVLILPEALDNVDEDCRATALLWFKYMSAPEALSLLEHFADRAEVVDSPAIQDMDMVRGILGATSSTLSREVDAIARALSLLTRLRTILSPSTVEQPSPELISLIACATHGTLPLCHDGHLPPQPPSDWSLSSVLPAATKRWSLRLQAVPPQLSISSFLSSPHLSEAHVDFISSVLYRSRSARSLAFTWLTSAQSTLARTADLVRLLFSAYDSADEAQRASLQSPVALTHLSRLTTVVAEGRYAMDVRWRAAECIVWMVVSSPNSRSEYLKEHLDGLKAVTLETLTPCCMYVARRLWEELRVEVAPLAERMLGLGLRWAVRHFVDDDRSTGESQTVLSNLVAMVRARAPVKSHLAEPVISAVVQDQLANKEGLQLARLLASSISLKPVTVNKFLQTVVQHAKFYDYCAVSSSYKSANARDSILDFLQVLFYMHPNNTCQVSHVEPLCKVYGGSLSASDLKILSILQLFEATRRTSVASLLSPWSATPDASSASVLDAVSSLDPSRVLKTTLEYPEWRKLAADVEGYVPRHDHLYDPVFVLLLFAQMLADGAPTSALAWVQLLRTNVVSLLIRALSAKDPKLREVAWAQVAALYRALENADLQERPHVMHILNLLKDVTTSAPSEEQETPRLPAYTTLLLAHALRGVFYPSNFVYPLTARFLLQRPTFDPTDVPMLYGMLYSASDDWKKERAWIVRFLSDGIVGSEEWRVLKRRHTWDLLASLFQSEQRDRTLRRGILEVLANVTCNARATTTLVLRHALPAWIEMQIPTMRGEEAIAWVRILGNVLAAASAGKMEEATGGEWRAVVSRCLQAILYHPACSQDVFVTSVPVTLRLCLLPGDPTPHIHALLARSVRSLAEMEADIAIPASTPTPVTVPSSPNPSRDENGSGVIVHRSQHLFDPPPPPSITQWGECVEALWRVSMTLPQKTEEWDGLCSRLLVWRAVAGREGNTVGEWVRKEVLCGLEAE